MTAFARSYIVAVKKEDWEKIARAILDYAAEGKYEGVTIAPGMPDLGMIKVFMPDVMAAGLKVRLHGQIDTIYEEDERFTRTPRKPAPPKP